MSDDLAEKIKRINPGTASGIYSEHQEAVNYFESSIPEYTEVLQSNHEELETKVIEEVPDEIKMLTNFFNTTSNYLNKIPGIEINDEESDETDIEILRDIERKRYNIVGGEREELGSQLRLLKHSSQQIVNRLEELTTSYDRLKDIDVSKYPPHKTGQKFEAESMLKENIFNVLDLVLFDSDSKLIDELVGENPIEEILESSLEDEGSTEYRLLETYVQEDPERKEELEKFFQEELENE